MPPNWEPSPWLTRVLFESPWGVAVFLVVLGVVLFVFGGRAGKAVLQRVGLGCVIAAVGLVVLAAMVETDREALLRRTAEITAAVRDPFNLDKLIGLSTDDATLLDMPKASLIPVAKSAMTMVKVSAVYLTTYDAHVEGDGEGQSYLAVTGRLSETKTSGGASGGFKVQAILHWRKVGGEWKVDRVEQMRLNDQDAGAVIRALK
jgi:hypothetical protein